MGCKIVNITLLKNNHFQTVCLNINLKDLPRSQPEMCDSAPSSRIKSPSLARLHGHLINEVAQYLINGKRCDSSTKFTTLTAKVRPNSKHNHTINCGHYRPVLQYRRYLFTNLGLYEMGIIRNEDHKLHEQ
jgi:hypothetical protein